MTITPAMNLAKDMTSTVVSSKKAESAPDGSLPKFSAALSTFLAGVGSTLDTVDIVKKSLAKLTPPITFSQTLTSSLAGVSALKNTMGAFPAIAAITIGAKKDDKPMVMLGALNLFCASGFHNLATEYASEYSKGMANKNMASMVKNTPPVMKFAIGVITIAYSMYGLAQSPGSTAKTSNRY